MRVVNLPDVVVKSKRVKPVIDNWMGVTPDFFLTAEDIEEYNIKELPELFSKLPNVKIIQQINPDNGLESIVTRISGYSDRDEKNVRILINGIDYGSINEMEATILTKEIEEIDLTHIAAHQGGKRL
jgi:hypothetical protein